jgi:hypothetical protein
MRIFALILAAFCFAAMARADIFQLQAGGLVRGELVNAKETPREHYHVKTSTGGHVLLPVEDVKNIDKQSPAEAEFDRIRWNYTDSIEDQWKLAEWCREQKLTPQRKEPLERILTLDPNHEQARYALGYSQIGGKWVQPQEHMESQGYVRKDGRWMTPQEAELIEREEKVERAEKDWIKKVKRYRGFLADNNKHAEGRQGFLTITDPYAGKALAIALKEERIRENKLLFIEALANIGTPNTMDVLVIAAIENTDAEVRIACLDKIVRANYPGATPVFVQKLKDPTNKVVNRAAAALAALKDPAAVSPLIDALLTTHKEKFVPQNPGQMSSTFGGQSGSPGGFSFGQAKEKIITKKLQNPEVLTALVTITGINFNYDNVAWRRWYTTQKKPSTLDARRD